MALQFLESVCSRFSWRSPVHPSAWKMGRSVLLTSLLLTSLILAARQVGLLQGVELAAYDQFVRFQSDRGEDDRLLVVGISETDLQTLQEWPISDRTLATALQILDQGQPRVIGVDIFRDIPIEPGRDELLNYLSQSERIVSICKVSSEEDPGTPPPPNTPIESIGFSDLVVDPGGILRRSLLMMSPPSQFIPLSRMNVCNDSANTLLSLSFQTVLRYLQTEGINPEWTVSNQLKLGEVLIPPFTPNMGGYQGADAAGYQVLLRYRSADQAVQQVSLQAVLNREVDPALIRDRIVLIGYTTAQAKDEFYTPYSAGREDSQKMPGVVVHAQSASQLLDAVLEGRSLLWDWSFPQEALWIVSCSLAGGVLAWYIRRPILFSVVIGAVCGGIYLVCLITFFQGGWIPVVPAILACAGTAIGVVLLDRFNSSPYGQTVYRKVKTLFKIDIAIDHEKVEKQVSEITETDYFKDLQNTVKRLREKRHGAKPSLTQGHSRNSTANQSDSASIDLGDQSSHANDPSLPTPTSLEREEASRSDILDKKDKKLDLEEDTTGELDYINRLKRKNQHLKDEHKPH